MYAHRHRNIGRRREVMGIGVHFMCGFSCCVTKRCLNDWINDNYMVEITIVRHQNILCKGNPHCVY